MYRNIQRLTKPITGAQFSNRCVHTCQIVCSFPKIYTRSGDGGTSALFTGERRPKSDHVFEALGATDELSSHLALAREFAIDADHPYVEKILRVQCILQVCTDTDRLVDSFFMYFFIVNSIFKQDVSSSIATPKSSARESHMKKVRFSSRHATELEEWIDEYSAELQPLENFILPVRIIYMNPIRKMYYLIVDVSEVIGCVYYPKLF